jgi:hypothetical protein
MTCQTVVVMNSRIDGGNGCRFGEGDAVGIIDSSAEQLAVRARRALRVMLDGGVVTARV